MHEKLGTVYAFKAEIDAWWQNGRPRIEQKERARKSLRQRMVLFSAAACGLAIVAVGAGVWWWQRVPVLPFAERDWVLISTFENRTREAALDGVLEYALERELSASGFVNVVPRVRVEDALWLMKKPVDTPVNAALGREICLRDGGIRVLVSGLVDKLDATYLLTASLVEPGTGRMVRSFSEEASTQKEVLRAIRGLSIRLREALGEELIDIRKSEQQLERVTTPSLAALREYSKALRIAWQGNWAPAAELLELALREDPEFASAHSFLARCYVRLGKYEQAAVHHQRARDLAKDAPSRERYFILAGYYEQQLKDDEKAAQAYENLLNEYPDHLWGVDSLQWLYERLGQIQKNVPIQVRYAELRPNDAGANLGAARALAIFASNRARAEPYLQRARTLISSGAADPAKAGMFAYLWLELLPVYELWAVGEPQKALNLLEQVRARFQQIPEVRAYPLLESYLAHAYMTLGKLQQAEVIYLDRPPDRRGEGLTLLALHRGDQAAYRQNLKRYFRDRPSIFARMLLARSGHIAEAESGLNLRSLSNPGYSKILRGQIALARKRTAEAIPLLEEAIPLLRPWGTAAFFLASEALATAWEQQGNLTRAVQVLEAASREKQRAVSSGYNASQFWMWNQMHMAKLLRKVGRAKEARLVDDELKSLLAIADADHIILIELRAASLAGVVSPRK
jgi:tetratricopeptide (TPR) repeat protein